MLFNKLYERFKRFCTEWDDDEYDPSSATEVPVFTTEDIPDEPEFTEDTTEVPTFTQDSTGIPEYDEGYMSSEAGTVKMMSYFTIDELCRSTKANLLGISNIPDAEARRCLQALIDNVLDPARREFGLPITVTSGYRCYSLNAAVGGVHGSQHERGQASDLTYTPNPYMNATIFDIIRRQGNFDQLLWEKGTDKSPAWVHVSYNPNLKKQRGEVLRTKDGKTYYKM